MIDVFDSDSAHGRVYQALVLAPRSSVHSISARTSLPEAMVRSSLIELQRADVVVSVDVVGEVWDAKRPDIVAAGMLRRIETRRAQLHEAEARLTETFRFARTHNTGALDMELLEGREATFDRYRAIQKGAHCQVRAIDRPPYYWDEAELERQEQLQSAQMSSGISYRTIYQESERDSALRTASMARTVANGESARVMSDPPVKITIVDNEVALVALDPPTEAAGRLVSILVYQSALLETLISVFESLWRLAVPVNLAGMNQTLSRREREILTLMASGAGDDAIARRLGLSRRTIVRDTGRLLEHLGATTRFQAGAQAARRGWL